MSGKEKEDVKEIIQFIMKMLKLYPKERPTAEELLGDKFFTASSRVAPTPNGNLRGLRSGNSHVMAFDKNGALLLELYALCFYCRGPSCHRVRPSMRQCCRCRLLKHMAPACAMIQGSGQSRLHHLRDTARRVWTGGQLLSRGL